MKTNLKSAIEALKAIVFEAEKEKIAQEVSEFLKRFEPLYNYSIGHLLCNDKEKIILGFLIMDDKDENPAVKHWQLIPKGMVKKITKLKEITK